MKRALLIAGGTVGGLGAVLAITPPQLGSSEIALSPGNPMGGAAGAATTSTSSSSTSASSTSANEIAAQKSSTSTQSTSTQKTTKSVNSSKSAQSQTSTNSANTNGATATSPAPVPAKSGATGDFTGTAINVGYGLVQVKISVENGKIVDAVAVQAPSGRNDRYTSFSVPELRHQTLAAQSDAISGVSGASYTSYGWYKSLQSALTKAGML